MTPTFFNTQQVEEGEILTMLSTACGMENETLVRMTEI